MNQQLMQHLTEITNYKNHTNLIKTEIYVAMNHLKSILWQRYSSYVLKTQVKKSNNYYTSTVFDATTLNVYPVFDATSYSQYW